MSRGRNGLILIAAALANGGTGHVIPQPRLEQITDGANPPQPDPTPQYKIEQDAARRRLRGGYMHENRQPGQRLMFRGSGAKYIVGKNGAMVSLTPKLTKAQRKQAKKLRRQDREQAAANFGGYVL